ncbi:MAG: hypothetical protein AAB676_05390, partial [Verrucomicrobiota bacterium]
PLFLEKPLRRQAQVLRYVQAARRHSVLIDFVNGLVKMAGVGLFTYAMTLAMAHVLGAEARDAAVNGVFYPAQSGPPANHPFGPDPQP